VKKENDPCVYLWLQKKLLELTNIEKELRYHDAKTYLSYVRIPKSLYPIIMKELERLELIEKVNRWKIKVINCEKCEKLERLDKVSHEVGVW